MKMPIMLLLLLCLCAVLIGCDALLSPSAPPAAQATSSATMTAPSPTPSPAPSPTPVKTPVIMVKASKPALVVRKSERILELYDGDTKLAGYSIGLGWSPEGHKQKEGDGKTPEGTYRVCVRNSESRFYLSLGVSYPNRNDAEEALARGDIDRSTYQGIVDAHARGDRPPWNTPLGGEIMIHGHGGERDWTAGCIAVDNEVMDVLWANCKIGTVVTIVP